jgi:hypothetical protein
LAQRDLITQLEKAMDRSDGSNVLINVVGVFEALKFRLRFLATTETNNAYNQGFAKAARALDHSEAYVDVSDSDDICSEYRGKSINLFNDKLPPFHTNCSCKLTLTKKEGS